VVALRIFRGAGKPVAIAPHELKKLEVIGFYYSMTPWPNMKALACELAEKNKVEPKRYGKGSTDMNTFHRYIARAIREFEQESPNLTLLLRSVTNKKPKPKR
jgi:hypothetical protein